MASLGSGVRLDGYGWQSQALGFTQGWVNEKLEITKSALHAGSCDIPMAGRMRFCCFSCLFSLHGLSDRGTTVRLAVETVGFPTTPCRSENMAVHDSHNARTAFWRPDSENWVAQVVVHNANKLQVVVSVTMVCSRVNLPHQRDGVGDDIFHHARRHGRPSSVVKFDTRKQVLQKACLSVASPSAF